MSWENKSRYYTESIRRAGKVTRVYHGRSVEALRWAVRRELRREEVADERRRVAGFEQAVRWRGIVVDRMLTAFLAARGYYQHHGGGEWRRRRKGAGSRVISMEMDVMSVASETAEGEAGALTVPGTVGLPTTSDVCRSDIEPTDAGGQISPLRGCASPVEMTTLSYDEQFKRAGERASDGDVRALEELRGLIAKRPKQAEKLLELSVDHVAGRVEDMVLELFMEQDLYERERTKLRMSAIRRDLVGDSAPKVEQMLAEQVTLSWLQKCYAESLIATMDVNGIDDIRQKAYLEHKAHLASHRYLASLRSLAQVQRLRGAAGGRRR